MRSAGRTLFAFFAALAVAAPAAAQESPSVASPEDVGPSAPPFKEGDVITYDEIEKLRPYVPPEFWANRDFFFYEGMKLHIGSFQRDYPAAVEYEEATQRFAGEARIGPDDSLENYTAGQPFPMDQIDCENDPQAGTKVMWNFDYQWDGDGAQSDFFYSYWDRGERLPLYYEGTAKAIRLSHRVEKEYLEKYDGDLFRNEKRKGAFGIEVTAPFDARGIALMTYRYKAADNPRATSKNDDTWVYVPTLRRVRRISTAQRTDAVSGTDFTFDDLRSFAGIVPQYSWECQGEVDILAPMNTQVKAYPYNKDHNFGPYGLSFADDNWEMRRAMRIRMTPKNDDHPYHHKDFYLDKQTLTAHYSFAYDQKEELWKIIWHNKRWSEDHPDWYEGWDGVPVPSDMRVVSDIIANVQTGTGNRIEFWNVHGTPLRSRGRVRRYIDIGRLTRSR